MDNYASQLDPLAQEAIAFNTAKPAGDAMSSTDEVALVRAAAQALGDASTSEN